MINKNELRIGNYVYPYDDINLVSERQIFRDYIEVSCDDFINTKHLFAIPLTEEWLLKFGFVSNPYQDRYELDNIYIQCDKTKGTTDLWIEGANHIKYVHSLQNYVFALIGQELELK